MVDPTDSKPTARGPSVDPFNLQVGAEVRRRREAADLSLADLAERAGIARSFLWRAETGRQGMTVKSLAQVALALRSTSSAILSGIIWRRPNLKVGSPTTTDNDADDDEAQG